MIDSLLSLAAYGFLVRMVVEFLQSVFKISGTQNPRLVQAMAAGVSTAFVYWLGVNPVSLMSMGGVRLADGIASGPVGVALLTGAAMSTNDILDLIPRLGRR